MITKKNPNVILNTSNLKYLYTLLESLREILTLILVEILF